MNYFLVTSAINVPYGELQIEERLNQTIETAESIKRIDTEARVILLEGGVSSLTSSQREALCLYEIMDFTDHPTIKFAHDQKLNSLYIKGPCESLLMMEALNKLDIKHEDRVFKVSGRHKLSERFDLNKHIAEKGKYVFRKERGVEYYGGDTIKWEFTPYQYKTRLYSFCGSLIEQARRDFSNIHHGIIELYVNNSFIDIEHAMYRVINPGKVTVFDVVGLIGMQAETRGIVDE